MLEALLHPVKDGSGTIKGRPAFSYIIEDILGALRIEVGLLLACEACIGQILGSGTRPYRYEDLLAFTLAEFFIARLYGLLDIFRHFCIHNKLLCRLFSLMKLSLLINIDIKCLEKLIGNARSVDEISEGLGRHCEPTWHRNANLYHLTQACALAAHYGKIILSHFFQPHNSVHQIIHLSL